MVLLAADGLRNDEIATRLNAVARSSRSGASASSNAAWRALRLARGGPGGPRLPHVRAEVIAMACELPAKRGVALSRWSSDELAREAVGRGIIEQISGATVWRWLSEDAIKPWQHAPGSFRATRVSPSAPGRSSTPTPAIGRASACTRRLRDLRR